MEYSKIDRIILWLSMCLGVGSNKFFKLMDYYGDVEEIWNNFDEKDPGLVFLTPRVKGILAKTHDIEYVNNCIKKWNYPKFVTFLSGDYPTLLKEIADPPLLLYHSGEMKAFEKSIGIIGSRNCTKYGLECAKKFAKELSMAGVTVVSGGARGIDGAAHEGALIAKGRTICVLGCGIDIVYPPEHDKLFYNILTSGGAIITEYPPGIKPNSWHFPERNRIISGMTNGVIVVEAGERSGALITANISAQEGREVFCVPGDITSSASKGTNGLIKNGANLVDSVDDIMFQCGWNISKTNNKISIDNFDNLNDTEKTIVSTVYKKGNITIDELCMETGLGIVEVNSAVTMLEINGIIKKMSGNILTI